MQPISRVINAFQERFNKTEPRSAALLDLGKRAFARGNVKDRPPFGRRTTHLETCAADAASIECSPVKLKRKRLSELGVPGQQRENT